MTRLGFSSIPTIKNLNQDYFSLPLAALYLLCLSFMSCDAQAIKAPDVQLATVFHPDIKIEDYYVSEKLDGVRAYWDGKQLISRQGMRFHPPSWFTQGFPSVAMDGELWIARGQFELVSGIVRKEQDVVGWNKVRLMIFDLPSHTGPFSQRVESMAAIVTQTDSPYLAMIPQFELRDMASLDALLVRLTALGAEGLMLHRKGAYYASGRSQDLMKLKQYQDEEGVVLEHLPGKGKYRGMMGALLVRNADGVVFKLGTGFSDKQRQSPPPVGSIITYKFYGKTKYNKPRFASFMRIRK